MKHAIATFFLIAGLVAGLSLPAKADDNMLRADVAITLPLAKLMAQACEDLAESEGFPPIALAIMDQHMNLKLFLRQDGAPAGSIEFARLKARTAAALGMGTLDLHGFEHGGEAPLGLTGTDGYTLTPGGKAIRLADGTPLGGVGVSGASGKQDGECAQIAVDKVKELAE